MKILEQFYRGRGRRQKVRRLAALLLSGVPPLNLLMIYVGATPNNTWRWETFTFWWHSISYIDLLPSMVLVGAGLGLWHNHPWTRRAALAALTVVTLANAAAAVIYKHLGLNDIAIMVLCNAAVGYIIYREEFPILELPPLPKIDARKIAEAGAQKFQQFRTDFKKNVSDVSENFEVPAPIVPEVSAPTPETIAIPEAATAIPEAFEDLPSPPELPEDLPEKDLGFRANVPLHFSALALKGVVMRISPEGFWVDWESDARGKIALGRSIRVELFPGLKVLCRLQTDDGKRQHYEFVQLSGNQRNALKHELSRYIKIAA